MYSEENRSLYLLSYTHTHTRNLPSPINRTPGEQEGKNQIQSGYWFGGVFENGRELCVHLHTPHHVKAHFCQKQPQFLFKGVSEAHEAAAGELSCLLCCSRTVIVVPLSKVLQVTAWVKLRLTCLNPTFAEHEYHCKPLQQRPRLQNPPSCHKHWGVHMGKYKQTADFSGLVLWYAACSFRTACLLRFAFLAWDSMSLPSKWPFSDLPNFCFCPQVNTNLTCAHYANLMIIVTDFIRLNIIVTLVWQDICTDA